MKTRIGTAVLLILLGQAASLPLLESEATADTRITITFAAGGVACGVYYFIRFSYRSSLAMEASRDEAAALFNRSPDGWRLDFPAVHFTRAEHLNILRPGDASETAQIELLRWRF